MNEIKKITAKFRVWINSDDEKLLGKGRVELLELIKETGSITNAAKEMKMSYHQAWQMVKEMNERSSAPLVEKQLGGKHGGGAYITEAGDKAIDAFHKFESKINQFIEEEIKNLTL